MTPFVILHSYAFAMFAMVTKSSGLAIWLESDYVFQGDVFNISCSLDKLSIGPLALYYPEEFPNAVYAYDDNVSDDHSDYVTGYSGSNSTDRYITIQVSGANFSRDDGDFECRFSSTVKQTVDIRVYSNLTSEYNSTHAFCTTSCGYPVDTSWYEGDTNDPLPGHTEVAENCTGEYADTKLRIVTTSIPLDIPTKQQLKCCVINTDETDKTACADIDLTPPSTTEDDQLTSDQTTVTSAANTSTQNTDEATITDSTHTTEETTSTGAAYTTTNETDVESSSSSPTTPDPTTEPPWTEVVIIRTSDNVTDPEGEITIFCETLCGYPKSNFSWYTYNQNTNATTLFELFGDFRTDTASPCDQEQYTTTNSTLLIGNDQYKDVAAFICRADNGHNATAASIAIFRNPWSLGAGGIAGIVVAVVVVVVGGVAVTVYIIVFKKKNKKSKENKD